MSWGAGRPPTKLYTGRRGGGGGEAQKKMGGQFLKKFPPLLFWFSVRAPGVFVFTSLGAAPPPPPTHLLALLYTKPQYPVKVLLDKDKFATISISFHFNLGNKKLFLNDFTFRCKRDLTKGSNVFASEQSLI